MAHLVLTVEGGRKFERNESGARVLREGHRVGQRETWKHGRLVVWRVRWGVDSLLEVGGTCRGCSPLWMDSFHTGRERFSEQRIGWMPKISNYVVARSCCGGGGVCYCERKN